MLRINKGGGAAAVSDGGDVKIVPRRRRAENHAQELERPKRRRYRPRVLIGEGNFDFSCALIAKHPEVASALLATEISELDQLKRYEQFRENFRKLTDAQVKMAFGIDARTLHTQLEQRRFPRIQFNFPHDGRSYSSRTLYNIMMGFFNSAGNHGLQEKGDQIHIVIPKRRTKEDDDFFQGYAYGLYDAPLSAGYRLERKRVFNSDRYPGYVHAKTTDRDASAAVAKNATEYVFKKVACTPTEIKALKREETPRVLHERKTGNEYRCLPEMTTEAETTDYEERAIDEQHLVERLQDKKVFLKLLMS